MVLLTLVSITQVFDEVMKTYPWAHEEQVVEEMVQEEQGKSHL